MIQHDTRGKEVYPPASFGLSASNSYRLFLSAPLCTTNLNVELFLLDCWHATTLLRWYEDVFPLSNRCFAFVTVGMIYTAGVTTESFHSIPDNEEWLTWM